MTEMEKFVKTRNKAFIAAIVDDDWNKFFKYAKKYSVPLPESEDVMKAGVYKAVQYCTDISEDIKQMARIKCIELGFSPYIDSKEERNEQKNHTGTGN